MEPTTGASPHQAAGEQHIRHLHQSRPLYPPVLAHQRQYLPQQGLAEAALEAHLQQGLVAVQDLERQRLRSLQDLAGNQHQ